MQDKNKYVDNSGVIEYKKHQKPMTLEELRGRLKHIEILCCGLSIDLSNEIQLREGITVERDNLLIEVKRLSNKLYQYEYNKKRKKGVRNV